MSEAVLSGQRFHKSVLSRPVIANATGCCHADESQVDESQVDEAIQCALHDLCDEQQRPLRIVSVALAPMAPLHGEQRVLVTVIAEA